MPHHRTKHTALAHHAHKHTTHKKRKTTHKAAHLVKGSLAAKQFMARIRAMKKH